MGLGIRLKMYSVKDKQLIQTVPLTKVVKQLKFFEITDHKSKVDGVAIALHDEIMLLIIQPINFVL